MKHQINQQMAAEDKFMYSIFFSFFSALYTDKPATDQYNLNNELMGTFQDNQS